MKKTTIGLFLTVTGLIVFTTGALYSLSVENEYESKIGSNWDLSIKASTIEQKSEYMDAFVLSLEQAELSGLNDALLYPTPDTDFDENLKAVKSLQSRLKEISVMNPNSFEYQTAMQQITEQEQEGGGGMVSVLQGCWTKKHYYIIWNPIIYISFCLVIAIVMTIGISMWFDL